MIDVAITKDGEILYYLIWIKNYGFIKLKGGYKKYEFKKSNV